MMFLLKIFSAILYKIFFAKVLLALALMLLPAGYVYSQTIAKSFGAKTAIEPGRVVTLAKDNPENVELAPAADVNRIYGVVIEQAEAAVTLQKENQQVFVATSGTYPVLVSVSNGSIKSGDYLSMSKKSDGIAGKASVAQEYVVGKAVSNFDGRSDVVTTVDGSAVGKIKTEINPGKNPLIKGDRYVPAPLLRLAYAIAGESVSAARIYSALIIFLITLIVAASLILVGVRSSIISIGRNPLSKQSIMHGLTQVIVAAGLVFFGGLGGVYIVLNI